MPFRSAGIRSYNPVNDSKRHVEREIKLEFASAKAAREAVAGLGAAPQRARRRQDDRLFDTPDGRLAAARSTLRVRIESPAAGRGRAPDRVGSTASITFKGPPQADVMKVREELETDVSDGALMLVILEAVGFTVTWRYQKYREEFKRDGTVITIDETPCGVFVELEGEEADITALAAALGRTEDDYIAWSYRNLWEQHCESRGIPVGDMVFG